MNVVHGDESGVVNVLEPHPTTPILATSGTGNPYILYVFYDDFCRSKKNKLEFQVRAAIKMRIRINTIDGRHFLYPGCGRAGRRGEGVAA